MRGKWLHGGYMERGCDVARRKKGAAVDLADSHDLTAGLIDGLVCPASKVQAFLRDAKAPGLRVRVTAAGAKS